MRPTSILNHRVRLIVLYGLDCWRTAYHGAWPEQFESASRSCTWRPRKGPSRSGNGAGGIFELARDLNWTELFFRGLNQMPGVASSSWQNRLPYGCGSVTH